MVWEHAHSGTRGQMRATQGRLWWASRAVRSEGGSIVLLTLLACLAVALCVQVLSVVVVCGMHALNEEAHGRQQLAARDAGLGVLRSLAAGSWAVVPWRSVATGAGQEVGRLAELEGSLGWALLAEVKDSPESTPLTTAAWVERGRDGLELPLAAVVAASVNASWERVTPWLVGEHDDADLETTTDGDRAAVGYVGRCDGPALIGEGCALEALSGEWRLDDGWRSFFEDDRSFGDGVWVMRGVDGSMATLPAECVEAGVESAALVVVTGGADLDARWRGDISAVIVADGGSVLLDGTVVKGAVFASDEVDVGLTGQVEYRPTTLRWATDVSLRRTRLTPGTREEGTQ
ncbi:MAG: hypothetical protein A2W26_10365 [Acidobacteria bacterium RBG_16_64_8]|nr:MAG: hypothetical protein A2W26_10365 [Acidobacteria bacterium RBG_16_64_8]